MAIFFLKPHNLLVLQRAGQVLYRIIELLQLMNLPVDRSGFYLFVTGTFL